MSEEAFTLRLRYLLHLLHKQTVPVASFSSLIFFISDTNFIEYLFLPCPFNLHPSLIITSSSLIAILLVLDTSSSNLDFHE